MPEKHNPVLASIQYPVLWIIQHRIWMKQPRHCITGKPVRLHSNASVTASSSLNVNQMQISDLYYYAEEMQCIQTRVLTIISTPWQTVKLKPVTQVPRLTISGTVRHQLHWMSFQRAHGLAPTRTGFPHERVSHAALEIPHTHQQQQKPLIESQKKNVINYPMLRKLCGVYSNIRTCSFKCGICK